MLYGLFETFLAQTRKFYKVIHFALYLEQDPSWLLQDATFEKMGALMSDNSGRLIGLYDELSSFLTRINLFRGRGLSDTHELAMFLELYNANEWTHTTGKNKVLKNVTFSTIYTSLYPLTKCTLHGENYFNGSTCNRLLTPLFGINLSAKNVTATFKDQTTLKFYFLVCVVTLDLTICFGKNICVLLKP